MFDVCTIFKELPKKFQKSQLIILDVMTARETALRELHLMEEGPIAGGMEEKHMIEGVEDDISRNSRSHLAIRSEILLSAINFLGQRLEIENDGTIAIAGNRAVARTLIGGGGCLFIYSCSARLVSFQIDKFEFDFKRN